MTGTWGEQCGETCEAGCSGEECDPISGHCTYGCVLGYNGPLCDIKNNICVKTDTLDVYAERETTLIVMAQYFTHPLSKIHIKFGNEEPCLLDSDWAHLNVTTGIVAYKGVSVNVTGFTHLHVVYHMFFEPTTVVNVTLDNQGIINYHNVTFNAHQHHIAKDCYQNATINNASSDILSPIPVERSSIHTYSVNWITDQNCLEFHGVNSVQYAYIWVVRYSQADTCWMEGNTKVEDPIWYNGTGTQEATFRIPADLLFIGFYFINIRAYIELSVGGLQVDFYRNINGYIEITLNRVRASLGSLLSPIHLCSEALLLDASTSEDPEGTLTLADFQFSWTCVMDDVLPCSIFGVAIGSDNITMPFTGPVVTLASRSLQVNSRYMFEVTVSATGRLDGKAQHSIIVKSDVQPTVEIICLSNCGDKLVPGVSWVVALNQTQDPKYLHSWSDMNIRWSVYEFKVITRLLFYQFNTFQLTLNDSLLHIIDTSYSFSVEYSIAVANNLFFFGSASLLNIVTNDMPVVGSCDCSPTRGFSSLTRFSISCTGFHDNDLPLNFRIIINDTVVGEGGTANFSDVVLPGGLSHDNYNTNITIEVTDKYNGTSSYNFLVLVYPSVTEYIDTINQPPVSTSGCVVSPLSGYTLITNYTVICSQFTDLDPPLTYYLYHKGQTSDTESHLYKGNDTKTTGFYLGEGLGENHTVSLVFRAKDAYNAATDIDLSVEVLPYSYSDTGEDILDFVLSTFLSGETADTSGLTIETIGILGNAINVDTTVNNTGDANRLQQRSEIRESLTQSLLHAEITPNFDVVNQVVQVLDSLVKVKEEVTEKQQEITVAVFHNLTEKFNDVEKTDILETRSTSTNLLTSMGSVLTLIQDRGTDLKEINTTNTGSITEAAKDEKLEKVKRNSLQMMASVEKVVDILTETIESANEAVIIQTPVMSVRVQEIDNMTETNLTLSVLSDNSSISLLLPPTQTLRQSVPGAENSFVYTQIVVTKDNMYNWDQTAERFTSSVVDVVVKDAQLQTKTLTNMSDPVTLQFQVEDQNLESNTLEFTYETARSQVIASSLLKVTMTDLDPAMTLQVYTKILESDLTLMLYRTTNETVSSRTVQQHGIPIPEGSADMLIMEGSHKYLIIAVQEGQTIAANETDVPFITTNVSVRIGIYNTACGFYDNAKDQWATDGCQISRPKNLKTMTCSCYHLTSFAAGFIAVPNLVDPITDATLFLTFFDNPVIVITVLIVWCLYLIMLVWARRKDKVESMKGGVNVLEDNCAEDKYVYVVGFVTGWWRRAGTTSNVFMCLHGSKGFSSKHLLSDGIVQHFQTGAEDWFVLTTPLSLGELQSIVVWHDNSGENPAWFLKQIVVRDVQTDKIWHFLYNDWLAVDRGVGRVKVEIHALTPEDLVQNSLYQFGIQSSKDLQNNHLWISIISCPAYSPFTRVQRLSCALSLLLMTMLTSLMFHGIPTDDPADQLSSGGITLSLSDIIIGIESGLIMFPINIIIMQLFTKLEPRPSALVRGKRSLADCPEEEDKSFGLQTSESKGKSKMGGNVLKGSSKTEQKKPFRFPWWVVYIAWTLVLSAALISSYFVMYGLMYGYQKSIEWLVSFFTAFFQSALVTQPLKVFMFAVLITFIFKKPVEFEVLTQRDNMKLNHDEDYCQTELLKRQGITLASIAPVKQAVRVAMPRKTLQAIRERLRLEKHITTILREMIMYFTFVAIVLFMVHGHQDVTTNYGATKTTEDMFVHGAYTQVTLSEVKKVEDMWKYLQDTAVPVLYSNNTGMMANGVGYLIGTARLRQKRIEKGIKCYRVDTRLHASLFPDQDCKVPFSTGDEEWRPFNASWAWPLPEAAKFPTKDSAWKYRSSLELKTLPFVGRFASYSGGGYVTELPTGSDAAHTALNDLRSQHWVDQYTRAIFLEFTSYNPNVDLFTVAIIIFELSNIGNIMPYYQFFSSKLNHYDSDLGIFVAVCESLFLVYLIGFTYFEVKKFTKLRKTEYFSDTWNYMEVMIIVLGYCTLGLFFQRLVLVDSVLSEYRKNGPNKFTSFYTAVFWDFVLTYIMAVLVMLVILKVFKLFRFNTKTTILMQTLGNARGSLLNFAFLFFIFFMAFALFGHLVFGYWIVDYKDVGSSIITLGNFLLGVSDYYKLEQAHSVLGPTFFVMFVFFIQYILLSVFVAIIREAQSLSRKTGNNEIALTKFVCERFLLMIGFLQRSDYK
ncbi:Polycystic kidney disease and receptor for egg jelly-related protein [Mizuhopecten yessoensis]|uniref:Polycystic kidney disease and receptor for egg jelly-related protein n=1 Tax=Mizuhopecten yessoensis TaxID=6573 RepID=A0A210R5K5_MIZYE|nr:Polycystic kidney disease and receptor for egg jelly-related protein [Mizuhopecten yessoensis]